MDTKFLPRARIFRFPKQATIQYIDSFLKMRRELVAFEESAVVFDLYRTTELSPLALCFLTALVETAQAKGNSVQIRAPNNKKARIAILRVKEIFKNTGRPTTMIADKICQLRRLDSNYSPPMHAMIDNLQDSKAITIQDSLRSSIKVLLNELLTNTMDHSSEKVCYTCAGAWGQSKRLHVSFLDFGIGIPEKLRTRHAFSSDLAGIKKMLKQGLTTRIKMEGGKGYKYVQDILEKNGGRLHLFSGAAKILYKYDRGDYEEKKARESFIGTCIDMEFDMDGPGFYDTLTDQEEFLL